MKQIEDKKSVALSYFTVADKFLRLFILSTNELIQSKNEWVVISREKITHDKYEEETKWSDFNISIPALFNFYHGIELVLKGILVMEGVENTNGHRLKDLLNRLNNLEVKKSELINTIESITINLSKKSFLYAFFQENNIDDWYQSLKYPYRTDGSYFNHIKLKYGGQRTINDWKKIHDAAKNILGLAAEYYHSSELQDEL